VRLVVPATQRVVWRTLQLVQMDRFFAIHDSLEQALLAASAADVLLVSSAKVAS
jgi:hypothetical protein